MILCIESATVVCSVALCDRSGVTGLKESGDTRSHASMLTVFINELLSEAGIRAHDLEAVAVSKGPGSYTGLRIGVSAAKGISYGASIPLIGIDTTLSMFYGITAGKQQDKECNTLFCPMLDARRMEVYHAIYDCHGKIFKPVSAEVMNENTFMDIPEENQIVFFGDGAEKLRNVIRRKNVRFENFRISAGNMLIPALDAFQEKRFEDIAYFEPFYLKDFIATKPVKNILGNKLP
jgi:tRNA threonylcarbamoyladenosine biosynthesis protein TsaB